MKIVHACSDLEVPHLDALVMGGHLNELEAANITSNINWFHLPNFMSIRM